METFLYIIFFLSCVLLVIAVLLQPGKTDAGALFTSNVASAALNPRGTQSVLSKLTIAMAAVFMITALLLSLPAITGKVSVLETQGATPANTDAGSANSNAEPAANTANTSSEAAESEKPTADAKGEADAGDVKKEEAKPAESEKKDDGK